MDCFIGRVLQDRTRSPAHDRRECRYYFSEGGRTGVGSGGKGRAGRRAGPPDQQSLTGPDPCAVPASSASWRKRRESVYAGCSVRGRAGFAVGEGASSTVCASTPISIKKSILQSPDGDFWPSAALTAAIRTSGPSADSTE